MAAQIFPTTDTPGAREAQAIIFIDTALTTFAKGQQAVVTAGLTDLNARVTAQGGRSFAALSEAQQVALLTAIQTTPFFRAIRDGGGRGSIVGRNAFQRPRAEALALLDGIINIHLGKA